MDKYFKLRVAGIERDLPLCKVNDQLYIAAFVIFGDVELTEKTASALLEKAPDFDVVVCHHTAEGFGDALQLNGIFVGH